MNYAIELVFDEEGQKIVNGIRKFLVDNGVHDEAVKLNHISIADYKTNNVESLIEKVKRFSKKIKPFEIKLVSIETFMTSENVIFLKPIITEELIRIHKEFINHMRDFDGILNQYYDINKWMPHCTIAIRLNDSELVNGMKLLKENINLPIVVKIDRIDIINYPYNQVYMDKL